MTDTTIIPGATPPNTIFTGNHNSVKDLLELKAGYDNTSSVKGAVERFGIANLDQTAKYSAQNLTETIRNGSDVRREVESTSNRTQTTGLTATNALGVQIQETSNRDQTTTLTTSAANGVAIERTSSANLVAIQTVGTANAIAAKDTEIQVEAKTAQIVLEGAKNLSAIERSQAHYHDVLAREVAVLSRSLELQNERNTAALTLSGVVSNNAVKDLINQRAFEAAAKAAECCCEIKEKIRDDGDRTRVLINAQEDARLRARIVFLESRIPSTVSV